MKLRWIIFTLILATLLVSAVQPVLAQAEMERSGLRPDAPEYAVRGPHWVGYKPLVIGEGLKAGLWYPALNPEGEMEEVAYEFTITTPDWRPEEPTVVYGRALLDAPIDGSSGPYPLVIFSHGFTLNPEWYSTLPEHYASHGFIVLAPQHTEQFDMDWSEIAPASIDRPLDIKQTLDYAEEINASDGDFAEQIDMENVAVVGHSYGGYTALAMAEAQYDMEAFTERCASLPEDDPAMFLCTPLVGKEEFLAERAGLEEVPEGLWPTLGDSRVTAIVPLAGDSYLFDEAGLAKITVPMMAIGGTADTATPYFWGSKPSYEYASSEKKVLVTLTGAEHMFMSSLCKDMPWITSNPFYEFVCFDPVWDKPRSLDLVHHFSTAFLLDTLKDDQAAYAVLAPEAVSFPGIEYEAEGYGPAVEIAESAPPVTKRSALAAVNDIILYYEIVGEGEPLLLLNGGTGCTESWAWGNQYEALGQHYTVIAPDSRAQGRSTDSDEPLSYQLMADDMVALLDHLDIDSAHVVGWSDGGNTGSDMAIRYPDRVRSLVATGAQFRADGMIPDELEWVENLTVDSFPPDWMDQCYRSIASEPDHLPIVIEKIRDMWLAEEYVPF